MMRVGKVSHTGHGVESMFDGVVRTIDIKAVVLNKHLSSRRVTDIGQHRVEMLLLQSSLLEWSDDSPLGMVELAGQSHQFSDRPLNVKNLGSLDADIAFLTADSWETDIRTILLHDLLDLAETLENDGIDFGRSDLDFFHVRFHGLSEVGECRHCCLDGLRIFATNDNLIFITPHSASRLV